jgi:hypothetical protein
VIGVGPARTAQIAARAVLLESREGVAAFLAKRKPNFKGAN